MQRRVKWNKSSVKGVFKYAQRGKSSLNVVNGMSN